MYNSQGDRQFFIPAQSVDEATSRIYALTGARVQGRGEKRALVALRDSLELDIDVARTNSVMAEHLAEALDVEWDAQRFSIRNKVNLDGLNQLLEGALEAFHAGSLRKLEADVPSTLEGSGWASFNPAVSKIEAVTRIARLTGAPDEWLGPGSKEHKSVLTNFADRVFPNEPLDRSSKTRLGRDLAFRLDVGWTDLCYSTGETISLEGLNTILAGAERRLGRLGATAADMLTTPEAEGAALTAALNDGWRATAWDARESIEWMRDRGVRGANENEWQGWFFEARAREILSRALPPNPNPVRAKFGNTVFDYSLNFVWDLKAHTERQSFPLSGRSVAGNSNMILNDEIAVRACVAEQGLGFLVLGGVAVMDENEQFVRWHREFKNAQGIRSAPSNSGSSRVRKARFAPQHVEAFWINGSEQLDAAVVAGQLAVRPQGRQAPRANGEAGLARRDKFQMNILKARKSLRVSRRDWAY